MNKCVICLNDNLENLCVECLNTIIFIYEHNPIDDEEFIKNPLSCIFWEYDIIINQQNINNVSWNKIKRIQKKSKQRIEYKKMEDYDCNLEVNLDKFLEGVEYIDMGILDKLIIFNNNKELIDKYNLFCQNIEEQHRINYHNEITYQVNLELPLNKNALRYCLEEAQQRGFKILERRVNDVLDKQ